MARDHPALCGCKKHALDFHGDHTATCTAQSGATKAHDWMVSVLGPLIRTAGQPVRTQQGVTASAGQRCGDVKTRNYLRDQAGSRSLVFDLSITHDRYGSSSHPLQNGSLTHPQDIDAALHIAAQRKINSYRRRIAIGNNTLTIRTFLFSPPLSAPAHACTANFCVFFFYTPTRRPRRTSRPLECQSDSFRFKRAAFYQSLKIKVGLAAAKAAALRINLYVEGCGIVAAPVHAPSRAPLLPPLLLSLTQSPSPPRSLVRDGQTSPHRSRLVVSRSTCPPLSPSPPREQLCNRFCSNTHTPEFSSVEGGLERWQDEYRSSEEAEQSRIVLQRILTHAAA